MSDVKRRVRSLLNRLPDNITLEDVQYHLYVLQKIDNGLAALERGETYTQEEVEAYFENKWRQRASGQRETSRAITPS
jgi:predicted transcriptional regulator